MRGGGIALNFERQATSKKRLQIQWTYPVYRVEPGSAGKSQAPGGTVATMREAALPRDEAFRWVAGDDRRPLLVVRECERCKGTDDALLKRRMDNEKTLLLATWFRCVKLPKHVLDETHPFHALFAQEHPPHLFLARPDGTGVVPMSGEQSQAELWQAMSGMLKDFYARDPEVAIKDWLKIMTQYDALDLQEQTVAERFDAELEKNGPKSKKLGELKAELDRMLKQRARLEEQEKKLRDLGLRPVTESQKQETGK
jgi:hypothetical protein